MGAHLTRESLLQTTPSARTEQTGRVIEPSDQHKLLARLWITEGKSFKDAALEAGYALNTAENGPADMIGRAPGFKLAVEQESRRIPTSQELQALAIRTLLQDLQNGKSRGLERTIETLGKMRIYDWFVRNSENSLGIFIGLSEHESAPIDAEILATSTDE